MLTHKEWCIREYYKGFQQRRRLYQSKAAFDKQKAVLDKGYVTLGKEFTYTCEVRLVSEWEELN